MPMKVRLRTVGIYVIFGRKFAKFFMFSQSNAAMSAGVSFISEGYRPGSYDSDKRVANYTIGELVGLFAYFEFWIEDPEGKVYGPFAIAIGRNDSDEFLDKKYGELSLIKIVELLERFTYYLSSGLKFTPPGTRYQIQGSLSDQDCEDADLRTAIGELSLKELGVLLERFVFAVTNIETKTSETVSLKGDPDDYKNEPSLDAPHGKFNVRDLLNALAYLVWTVSRGNENSPMPEGTLPSPPRHGNPGGGVVIALWVKKPGN